MGVCFKQTPNFYIEEGEIMAENMGSVNINVKYVVDNNTMKKVNNSISNLQTQAPKIESAFSSAFGKIGKVAIAAFSLKAIVDFSKKALSLASDLQEVQNVVDTTFGSMSTTINKFSKAAILNLGMSETSAKRMTGTYGAMAKSFGFTTEQAANMAMSITSLTGDVASFYNLEHDVAYTKLKSIFTGETESLKDLGVVMTQTALDSFALANGYGKTTKVMSEQEKVSLRYAFVMDKLKNSQGDFVRTQDGWANQTRVLGERFKAIMASVGDGLIILLTPAIKALNQFLTYLQVAADKFAGFVALLTGKQVEVSNQAKTEAQIAAIGASATESSEGLSDLAEGYEKAGASAKKASDSLASFDNTVQLSDTSSSGLGGSGSGVGSGSGSVPEYSFTDNTELQESETLLDKIMTKTGNFKETFKDLFDFTSIRSNLSSMGTYLKEIFENVKPSAGNFVNSFAKSLITTSASLFRTAKSLVNGLTGGMVLWLDQGKERISTSWSGIFDNFATGYENIGKLTESIGTLLSNFFSLDSTKQAIANTLTVIEGFITGTYLLASGLFSEITGLISGIFTDNESKLNVFFENVSILLDNITGTVKTIILDCFSSVYATFEKYIRPAFEQFEEGFSRAFGAVVDGWNNYVFPLFNIIATSIKNLWDNHLKVFVDELFGMVGAFIEMVGTIYNKFISPLVAMFIETLWPKISLAVSFIWGVVEGLVASIVNFFSGLAQTLKGVFEVITGILTGDFDKACEGMKNIVNGLINAISSTFTRIFNVIIGGINGLIRAANVLKIPGTEIGVNIQEIKPLTPPKLADGGIVYKPTNFGSHIAGEAGAEAIVPLENSEYTQTLAREIVKGIVEAGIIGGDTFNIENAFGDERAMDRLINNIESRKKQKNSNKGGVVHA